MIRLNASKLPPEAVDPGRKRRVCEVAAMVGYATHQTLNPAAAPLPLPLPLYNV